MRRRGRCQWYAYIGLTLSAGVPLEPALAQDYGVEVALGSGHADRGFIINDRPVIQPVTWVSRGPASFSVWASLPLAATTDGARPQIVELELTVAHEGKPFSIAPAVRMYFYHDPVSPFSTRSIEGWLYLSYEVGGLRLFSNHSVDVQTYRGAYYGEAGIAAEGQVAPAVAIGGSVATGWASRAFNDAYAGVSMGGLNRMSVEGWLTAHLTPHFYIGPHFEFSRITSRALRAELARPTFFMVRMTTGGEF